jgi:translocation and assembly module TamB
VKRALIIVLGALLLALAMATGAVVFLAQTEGGTRFLAAQAERLAPVRLDGVDGALARAVRVERVQLDLGNRLVEIRELAVALRLIALLFDGVLRLDSVAAAAVIVSETGEPSEPGPPPPLELPFMPMQIELGELRIDRLEVAGLPPTAVAAAADWREQGLAIHRLEVRAEGFEAALTGRLGAGSNPAVEAELSWTLPGTAWAGQGELRGRVSELALHHRLQGPVVGTVRGSADLSVPTAPDVDLRLAFEDLVIGDLALAGLAGRVAGTLDNLVAEVTTRVTVPGVPPFLLRAAAYGPPMGPLTLRNVSADALGGTVEAQGSLAWQPDLALSLGGVASDLEVDALLEEVSGRAGGGFRLQFRNGRAAVTVEDIHGTVDGRPVTGELAVQQLADGWRLDPVRLAVGDNRLAGELLLQGEHLELFAELAAPALSDLGVGLEGDAAGTVRLSGRWSALDGRLDLESAELSAYGFHLETAAMGARLAAGRLDGVVTAERLARDQAALSAVRLSAEGTLEAVDWRLAWADGEGQGVVRRDGRVTEVAVATARAELLGQSWRLAEPTMVRLQPDGVSLGPLCLAGPDASACLEFSRASDGRIHTRGALDRAPLALLGPWLRLPLAPASYLAGQWSLTGQPEALRGTVELYARELAYRAGADETIELPDLELSGAVSDGEMAIRLNAVGDAFTLAGEGRLAPLAPDGALSAVVNAVATDLDPLTVFDARIEQLSGALSGRVEVSGTPVEPRAEGRLKLTEGRLALVDPGVTLADLTLDVRVDDSGAFALDGTARQKRGSVTLSGTGSGLFGGDLNLDATLVGERLQAEHPDWDVRISPDLQLTHADGRSWLRGRVVVPAAVVRLTTLPTSVPSPSDDVVVLGREEDGAAAANPLRVDVEVVLGEEVRLEALGLTAELEGSLQARLDERGRTTLRGTLDVTEGVLAAQGQNLTIESGTVIYNGPVTRPFIDVRAVRVIENVTPTVKVGLHIRGDADSLTSSVFSEPAMSDTRALSFLVLGRDVEQSTAGSDGSELVTAAINLGLSRSQNIAEELMRVTGLDELSAMAEAQNSFAIVAGKRISDDLYVRYTYNTLSAVGTFLVRYNLGTRWQLEGRSGEYSAMDLMFSFEK